MDPSTPLPRELRRTLQRLYPEPRDIRRILTDANALPNLASVDFTGSAEHIWFSAIELLERHGPVAIEALLARVRAEYPHAFSPDTSSGDPLAEYRAWALARARRLPIVLDEGDRVVLSFDDLFVETLVLPSLPGIARPTPERTSAGSETGVLIASALATAERASMPGLVLRGPVGSGKTMLLQSLLLRSLEQGSESLGLPGALLPVLIQARCFEPADLRPKGLPRAVARVLEEQGHPELARLIRDKLQPCLLLIDSFDELSEPLVPARFRRWLEESPESLPSWRFVIASREMSPRTDARLSVPFLVAEILPPEAPQRQQLVRRNLSALSRSFSRSNLASWDLEAERADLLSWIETSSPDAAGPTLGRNPLLLRYLCQRHLREGSQERDPAQLLSGALQHLLGSWPLSQERQTLAPEIALDALRALAWQIRDLQGKALYRTQAETALARYVNLSLSGTPSALIDALRDRTGLIRDQGLESIDLVLPDFLDLLAAEHATTEGRVPELSSHANDPSWSKVLSLALPASKAGADTSWLPDLGERFTERQSGMVFLALPPGRFTAGATRDPQAPNADPEASPFEGPPYPVEIRAPYLMALQPVSIQEYERFVIAHPEVSLPMDWATQRAQDPQCPVTGVTWHHARAFAWWLQQETRIREGWQLDLPSEREWEWAARGPETRRYPWGSESPSANRAVFGQADGAPKPLGERPEGAGPFGHQELAGNLWEWCLDAWTDRPDTPEGLMELSTSPARGGSERSARVYRGGSCRSEARHLRATGRQGAPPDFCCDDLGFRLVLRRA